MWLFTKDGFFSVVHDKYCNDDEVMIRARQKSDLKNLFEIFCEGEILTINHTDYRYRMKVNKIIWQQYLANYVQDMSYNNIKNTVPYEDIMRSYAYHDVWSVLHKWQNEQSLM